MAYIGKQPSPAVLTASDITDGIVSNAKLAQDIMSAETELAVAPASTDEFLLSDAGTLKRVDASLVGRGQVLQVEHQLITATTATSATSFADTGFSIAITPSSTSSKILCAVNLQSVSKDSSINSGMAVRIVRDVTDIGKTTNIMYLGWDVSGYITASLIYLDSPSTTSETTYKVTFKNRESNPVRFNAYTGDTSTFTLYEIAS